MNQDINPNAPLMTKVEFEAEGRDQISAPDHADR
jgi:uncharacterized short protein YbdD (DUF466 family)